MSWDIDFISRENFKNHIKKTIANYGSKLESFNLEKFNKNTIDPIKMIFDKAVYGEDWKTIISNEIFRQRDKSNTNEIGYFHQKFFTYIKNCTIPQKGWDVIFKPQNGYILGNGNKIKTIYVEMKNKHNTMNSASSSKTYMKMQSQLLDDDTCACFLVEAIAKRSQDITWSTTINDKKSSHNRIRRVSIDKFYEIVTGQNDAFYKICIKLPEIVKEVLEEKSEIAPPEDIVYKEISNIAKGFSGVSKDISMILSMYMLGFKTYNRFEEIAKNNKNI